DRPSGFKRARECRSCLGLDANKPNALLIPGRDSGNQPTTSNRDEERIKIRRLLLEFKSSRALAKQRLQLIVGVDRERTAFFDVLLAGFKSVVVPAPSNHELRAISADALNLSRRANCGNEDRRRNLQAAGRVSHRGSMIPTRRGDDAG